MFGHSVVASTEWINTGIKNWGHIEIETGYLASTPNYLEDSNSREYLNIKYLCAIIEKQKNLGIKFYQTSELISERWRQPSGRYSGYELADFQLFEGIKIESLDGRVLEDIIFADKYDRSTALERQIKRISKIRDPLYLAIANALNKKDSLDAHHIWTSEKYKAFCFLTMDFKLFEKIEQRKDKYPFNELATKILTPMALGTYLGIVPKSPASNISDNATFPIAIRQRVTEGRKSRSRKK